MISNYSAHSTLIFLQHNVERIRNIGDKSLLLQSLQAMHIDMMKWHIFIHAKPCTVKGVCSVFKTNCDYMHKQCNHIQSNCLELPVDIEDFETYICV
jgi:hypothetical protein